MRAMPWRRSGLAAGSVFGGLAAVLLLSAPAWAEEEAWPKAEELIERSIKEMGGREALEKIKTRVAVGTLEIPTMNARGPFSLYAASPGKMYSVAEIEGMGKIESGSDGKVIWESSAMAGPRVIEGDERAMMERLNSMDAVYNWKKYYKSAETIGVETIDGALHYRVRLTPNVGAPEVVYYEKKTLMPVRLDLTMKGPMGEIPMQVTSSEFKEVDGVRIPHRQVVKSGPIEQVVSFHSVKQNVDIPADRFALPDPIKVLSERAARSPSTAPGKP